ncbi:MAG: carbohydrate kinase [Actinobacteria bacterium]|nr:carbohydrate kinase [Actinomycetota bacterium]
MRDVAVIGNLSRDVVDGGAPRVGGAPFHAARALRLLGGRTKVVARCSEADRRELLPAVVALGVPVSWVRAKSTAAFTLRYDGEERALEIGAPGEPWSRAEAATVGRAEWVHVGALTRADFPADVLATLARDRRVALDGQGLVRAPVAGPVQLDADFDEAVLPHLTVLKLSQHEADALGGEERVVAFGVPEVLLTQGSGGAVVLSGGRREQVPVRRIEGQLDPTGAGDAFLAAYVWARAFGHRPVSAARHAASTAARMLELARASVDSTLSR